MINNRQAGFTLIEVLVASLVILIFFTSILQLFNTLHQVNGLANNLTIATQAAQTEVEKFRNTPYNNIAVGTTDFSSLLNGYPSLGSPKSATAVTTLVDPNGLKRVDITVLYTDAKRPKQVSVSTLIALNGLNK